MSGSGFAQALVFGFLSNPASTRAEVNQAAASVGMELSTPGLDKRFTAKAAIFLDELLHSAVQELVAAVPQSQGLWQRFRGVYISDSTTVELPSALASVFAGVNGADDATAKVAVRWELQSGALSLWLSDGRVHDQQTGAVASGLPPGSLRLNDLGFFNLETFRRDQASGVDFFTRYKVGTTVYDWGGAKMDLVKYLPRYGQQPLDLPVLVGEQRLPARLLALPVPDDIVGQRRRRLRQQARRKQQPVSERALALAAWTIYLTSLPVERLGLQEAPILGMTRWQIECLFKVWKTAGQLDETRSQDPWRVWCEFYAKLLALLFQHWLTLVGCWQRLDHSLHRAAQLIRKSAFHLAFHLTNLPAFTDALIHLAHSLALTCGMSKRATHPLTFQYWLEVVNV